MSLGRHAYRHAVQPASAGLVDHVWISDDLLASAFQRFVKTQRRHASRVPGPLEARRRLARRKNCAMAAMPSAMPPDAIAGLFGRDGRQHLNWQNDHHVQMFPFSSPNDSAQPSESGSSYPYPPRPPIPPMSAENETVDPSGFVDLADSPVPPLPPFLPRDDGEIGSSGFVDLSSSSEPTPPPDTAMDDTSGFIDLASSSDPYAPQNTDMNDPSGFVDLANSLKPPPSPRDTDTNQTSRFVDLASSLEPLSSRSTETVNPDKPVNRANALKPHSSRKKKRTLDRSEPINLASSPEASSLPLDTGITNPGGFVDLARSSEPSRFPPENETVNPEGLFVDLASYSEASSEPSETEVNDQSGFVELTSTSRPADKPKTLPFEDILRESLESCATLEAASDVVRDMDINLRHEPVYSRLIFDHFRSRWLLGKTSVHMLASFLDEPMLNTPGAGNFAAATEHVIRPAIDSQERAVIFASILRALRLGTIIPTEFTEVIKLLQNLPDGITKTDELTEADGFAETGEATDTESLRTGPSSVSSAYERICNVLDQSDDGKYTNITEDTANTWLKILWERNVLAELRLASRILIGIRHLDVVSCSWIPRFITRWLALSDELRSEFDPFFAPRLLDNLHPDPACASIISVTEFLVLARKHQLLMLWHECLAHVHAVEDIPRSGIWVDVRSQIPATASHSGLTVQQRFVLRLWAFRAMNMSHAAGPIWKRKPYAKGPLSDRRGVPPIDKWGARILSLYQASRTNYGKKELLSSLLEDARELNLPANGFTIMAIAFQSKNGVNRSVREALESLEASTASFKDLFRDPETRLPVLRRFGPEIANFVREMDVTSPAFMERALNLARTGKRSEIRLLVRILEWHIPLKIALASSWKPLPDPSRMALVVYKPTEAKGKPTPDPHAALEMINTLATALSCSKELTPRQSYRLIYWIYGYLMRHQAPVKPVIVRAMYHAGVVRARREMRGMYCRTQYNYIMGKVQQVESPEVVRALSNPNFVWRG
ncbi:uncharacterized protein BO97DRAFT_440066 [Aspergillus homomorphus CBS 101889]|uniref:Uncharacterized protein n=1 Tax=Aspergillus homomorphus (strain CBS 101889) TaxID=1450537 RepID=A0A395I7R9_ASPHC|nr:hypothetical protein BO97DRAFT_440066 [Aspergillus homomorphus CBS 101889]RAL16262.1 hypothetical protein BO97DRAFT_440066 [Aspergillus homomorphus CBS 101889]